MRLTRTAATAIAAVVGIAALVVSVVVPGQVASAATYELNVVRITSGNSTVDSVALCPTQLPAPSTVHCPGYDTSLLASDQILRTGDAATVRFDFAFSGADTGVVLSSTLPLTGDGLASATWTSMPAACAAGSTLTDGNRTLNCNIANPPGPGDGSVTAAFRLGPRAYDGFTFTVPATIKSATSPIVNGTTTADFTSSSAPFWNIRKNSAAEYNTLGGPFFYRSPSGEPGYAIPTSATVSSGRVGGYSPIAGPTTWSEAIAAGQIGAESFRLLNWGNYGDGCASSGQAATPANPGYSNAALTLSNQVSAPGSTFDCSQPGGPGSPVQVTWQNPPAISSGLATNMWLMLWVPASDVPIGNPAAPTVRASEFDPNDVNGVSNYLTGVEPTGDNARSHGKIINADSRAVGKRATADTANPYASNVPGAITSTTRGGSFLSVINFVNNGTVEQLPVQVCDVFDVTTQRLNPYATTSGLPANTYAVVTTAGPLDDPILTPPYQPSAAYNGSNNFSVNQSAFTIEYAAGELTGTTPTTAPHTGAAYTGLTCDDASTATGWKSSPTDPAITAYAQTLGLTDPLDVVNRVRVTYHGAAVSPGQSVALKIRMTTRSTYREATTQAGQTILATTRIHDNAFYDYPQMLSAPWQQTGVAGPTIAGRIGVDTGVNIVSASPTNVQAGAPGQNRTTYTVRGSIAFGENVSNTQPLRVLFYLAAGMRYVGGSASRAPDHVLPQANGSTLIVWDLGNITGTTNGSVTTPSWTFVGEADPLAPTPSTNRSTAASESVSPTGTQLDTSSLGCGTPIGVVIPPTSNVPVQTTSTVAAPADHGPCITQGNNQRMDYQPVVIGNAFLSLAAFKAAFAPEVETGADDGVGGAEVGWDLTYKNTTSNTFPGVDIVDVLPYVGDGRSPASDFAGTVKLKSMTTTDTPSAVPNVLPISSSIVPPRVGTTFYVTDRAPAQIDRDPYAASNLQGGSTAWCVFGQPSCTIALADATAIRVISGPMATGVQRTVRLGFSTDGAQAGDLMNNSALAQVVSLLTPVEISGDAIEFAASSLKGTVWQDTNADGVIDAAESTRLAGVTVHLTGTSTASGETVNRTVVTDANGNYLVGGLPAGDYTVTVDQPSVRALNSGYAITADPDGAGSADGAFTMNLPLGSDVVNRDFGFSTSSISGTVFGDDDNNGAVDGGEAGIAGVTVTLTGTDDLGQPVSRTTSSGAAGAYTFNTVRPGTYQIVITTPSGLFNGQNVAGTAGGTGSFGTSTISNVTLAAGQNGVAYLFGLLEPEIIRGVVYDDENNNGVRDAGEPGIAGVTLTLSGAADSTTVTVADGTFVFADLGPGTYAIEETQPNGYGNGTNATGASVGTVSGDTVSGITVGDLSSTDSYSFGEVALAGLSGVVYDDVNLNGTQDADEPGIAGAEVTLSGEATVGPIVTGADGSYSFDDLAPGTYTITEVEAPDYIDALETPGSANGIVNNAQDSNTISAITVAPGEHATGYFFGDVRRASLAGVVFDDIDGDGAQDAGEAGIDGVTVALTGTDMWGNVVNTSLQTGVDGTYLFPNLIPGTYRLAETQPADYFDGADTAGTSGGTVGSDEFTDITVRSGASGTGYLFAERAPVTISGVVFNDRNANGTQDAGEDGIAGVGIALQGPTDLTTTTDASGAWSFEDLTPGTYSVTEQSQPVSGYIDGLSVAGTAGGTVAPNTISGIVLNRDATGYLFAEIPLSSLDGIVFGDDDNDGEIDATESGITGVTVTLTGTDDLGQAVSRTAVSDATGAYGFTGTRPGTYQLVVSLPADAFNGFNVAGTAGGTGSFGTSAISNITLAAGQNGTDYLFGLLEPQLIQGVVYSDINDNGVRDAGEPGIAGVTMTLSGDASATTETLPDGRWVFSGLGPGEYSVTEAQPSGFANGTNSVGTSGGSVGGDTISGIRTAEATTTDTYSFGDVPLAGIAGVVYDDLNLNGTQDPGEPGIEGAQVTLSGAANLGPVTTDADGAYSFDDLAAGVYTLTEVEASGYIDGFEQAGSAGGTVSNGQGVNTITGITLAPGVRATGNLFADVRRASLAGVVFNDLNGNAAKDAGEPGIDSVTVALTGTDMWGNLVNTGLSTAGDGTFTFTNLVPGTYRLAEEQPTDYLDGAETAGTTGGTVGADEFTDIVLGSGVTGTEYLFADLPFSSVAGTIWQDTDADGVVDGSEAVRLAGVSVQLTGTASAGGATIDRTVVTDASGEYVFAGLPAGSYTVTVDQTTVRAINPGYAVTVDPDGASAPNGSFSLVVPLGVDITDRSFGFATASLAGTVFGDDDNDGVVDASESGISGVTVTLTGTDDLNQDVSRTAVSDGTGAYVFADVRPGTYDLEVSTPSTLFDGQSVAGTAGGTSSFGDGTISTITLTAGENGADYLFGLLVPEVVQGVVYSDTNANGVQDAGEPGIAGVTLTLTNGAVTRTTQTLSDGQWAFAGVAPGTYSVTETQPSGFTNGTNSTGTSVGTVSGDTISGIITADITTTTDTYSFGEIPLGEVSGVVYDDLNLNGIQDADEPGISGAQVTLSGAASQGPVTTGADGAYSFIDLVPGTYTLTATEASGFIDGLEKAGSAGGTVANSQGVNAITGITLSPGTHATGYLFGDVRRTSLSGVVFKDTNGNDAQDSGEPGISDVTVALTGTDMWGNLVNTSLPTAADGSVEYANLMPGNYRLAEVQPVGYFDGAETAGTTGGTVGADEVTDILLGSGATGTGYFFAERAAVSISGVVFRDPNGNGTQDAGEAGIVGVIVTLEGSITLSTMTDASGAWSFEGLEPGTYSVTEQSQPLSGYVDGLSVAGTAGGTAAPNTVSDIVLNRSADGYRFAEIPLSIIRGTVWHDTNDNGAIDAGEEPLAGVQVTLSGTEDAGASVDRTAVTATDGTFLFGDLADGTYTLTEEELSNWSDGASVVGTAGGTAGVNTVTGIVITADTDATGYGFGERAAAMQLKLLAQTSDAQVAPGPLVTVGDPVRLGYVVTNNGDAKLTDVTVTDDALGEIDCPDTELDPGADMVCTLDTTAEEGQQEHSATVTAAVVPHAGGGTVVPGAAGLGVARAQVAPAAGPVAPLATQVSASASDVAFYFGMLAQGGITITANGVDATASPGPVFPSGTNLHIVVTFTNTGNVPLDLQAMTVGDLGEFDCGGAVTVEPGDTLQCTRDMQSPTGSFDFPLTQSLGAPDATNVDGETEQRSLTASATVFFRMAAPNAPLPGGMANTGFQAGWVLPVTVMVLMMLGGVLLVIGRRRKEDARKGE